jgi:hypothetical protein
MSDHRAPAVQPTPCDTFVLENGELVRRPDPVEQKEDKPQTPTHYREEDDPPEE